MAYYQSFICSPTEAPVSCLKNNMNIYIKITLKQLQHILVQVTPSSGSAVIRAY